MKVEIPVSIGELLDKITILKIKLENILDPQKLKNIQYEFESLNNVLKSLHLSESYEVEELQEHLLKTNHILWDLEDEIRILTKSHNYGETFIDVAVKIHSTNDERCRIKTKINQICESDIFEEKSY
jgi:hypothetical protein